MPYVLALWVHQVPKTKLGVDEVHLQLIESSNDVDDTEKNERIFALHLTIVAMTPVPHHPSARFPAHIGRPLRMLWYAP
jgi:hypothetical protein